MQSDEWIRPEIGDLVTFQDSYIPACLQIYLGVGLKEIKDGDKFVTKNVHFWWDVEIAELVWSNNPPHPSKDTVVSRYADASG